MRALTHTRSHTWGFAHAHCCLDLLVGFHEPRGGRARGGGGLGGTVRPHQRVQPREHLFLAAGPRRLLLLLLLLLLEVGGRQGLEGVLLGAGPGLYLRLLSGRDLQLLHEFVKDGRARLGLLRRRLGHTRLLPRRAVARLGLVPWRPHLVHQLL